MTDDAILERFKTVKHWYHQIPIRPGLVTPGVSACADTLQYLALPDDCTGLRVLDVGTRDGFFAFELERRGASVTAVDYVPKEQTGFGLVAELLGSKVDFRNQNIYDLSVDTLGTFDIVLFLGLLYHLPDPLEALLLLRSLCHGRLCVETQVIDNALLMPDGQMQVLTDVAPVLGEIPLMQFYPGRALNNDPTNYWAPNLCGLKAMLHECNFQVESDTLLGHRAIVNCVIRADDEQEFLNHMSRGMGTV